MSAARISVRRDAALDDALQTLSDAGWSVSDATRYALDLLAQAHLNAWDVGAASVGQVVDVVSVNVVPRPVMSDARTGEVQA